MSLRQQALLEGLSCVTLKKQPLSSVTAFPILGTADRGSLSSVLQRRGVANGEDCCPHLVTLYSVTRSEVKRGLSLRKQRSGNSVVKFPTLVCFPVGADGGRTIHRSYFILHPSPYAVSRNQVSFVTGLHSYLIQPVAKIHFIALAPQAPQMGGCNRAKGIVPQLEPLHGFRLLSFGVVSRECVSNMLHKSFLCAGGIWPPKPPEGGMSKDSPQPSPAYGRVSGLPMDACYASHPPSALRPDRCGVWFRAVYLGSPLFPQHHGARIHRAIMLRGGLPLAVCDSRPHSVGWY